MRAVIVACVHIHNMSQDTGFRSRSVLGLALCFPASMPLGQRYLGDTRPGCRDPRAVPPPSPVRPSPSHARLVVDFDDPVSLSIGEPAWLVYLYTARSQVDRRGGGCRRVGRTGTIS